MLHSAAPLRLCLLSGLAGVVTWIVVIDLGGWGLSLHECSPRIVRSDDALGVLAPADERFGKTAREFRELSVGVRKR